MRADVLTVRMPKAPDALLLAYTLNELERDRRTRLLDRVADATRNGLATLIVEPIARRGRDWWTEWTDRLGPAGARADEWRFPAALPALLREIADAAGLSTVELTARTISLNLPASR